MAERVDAVVVGAGVVGLAIARELALSGREVLVLEALDRFGSVTSSRNSEVVHAGIYYPEASLKTRLCIEGRAMLYAFCEKRGVAHRKIGKLVIAHEASQLPELERLAAHASSVGTGDVGLLDAAQARALEPALDCAGAMLSPETGIVDSHGLMLALLGEAEAHGAQLVTRSEVTAARRLSDGWRIHVGSDAMVDAEMLVNAAGLGAQALARRIEGLGEAHIPKLHYAKGSWFAYAGKVPFGHLVYPLPEPGGLGVHLTLDLAGQARFGPDVEWIEEPDYTLDPARHAPFAEAARRIWPGVEPAKLAPALAGIRPKLSGPGEPNADFRIDGPQAHGCPGLVNLFGIESPGLTASLAIGRHVSGLLRE
ncbi:NAD(P)/FAD-dependent oxidoreductase [Erythrobacter sp. HKB08]|uniref:NAD(P)/FAD-dependent oxidoreductase n=1 Tax=Erythrobacter sp. HKB08 TaxID=2502843 RepID=UPI0010092D2E|nr:NAD(P)/FAD-dependent oxidoreductase [Erythrobacter sp. HKB08]